MLQTCRTVRKKTQRSFGIGIPREKKSENELKVLLFFSFFVVVVSSKTTNELLFLGDFFCDRLEQTAAGYQFCVLPFFL